MLCCQMFASLLLLLIYQAPTPGLAQVPTPAPVKYAPNYCLRFRFNCNRPEKKSHVCCLYPLPENGNENEEEKRPTPNYGTAVKFRPVKLPKTNPKKGDNDNSGSGNDQRGDTNPGPSRNKPSASPANLGKGRPKFSPSSTATSAAAAKQPPLSKPSKKSRPSKIKSGARPRICERLVINCSNSPEHRCCQYKVPSQAAGAAEVAEAAIISPTLIEEVVLVDPPQALPEPEKAEEAAVATADNRIPVDSEQQSEVIVKKGEVEVVPVEIPIEPVVVEAQKKYEKIVNDEIGVGVLESSEPYQRIPAECFTQPINCDQANADNKCCMYVEPTR